MNHSLQCCKKRDREKEEEEKEGEAEEKKKEEKEEIKEEEEEKKEEEEEEGMYMQDRALALHTINLSLISVIPHGPPRCPEIISECITSEHL